MIRISLDGAVLRADLRELSERSRALKQLLRARWTRPMGSEQRELERIRTRATELCALRAWARGRLHLTRPPRGASADWDSEAYHLRVAERLAPSYAWKLEQSA